MRVDVLDPVASAAPGDTATYRLRVFNDTRGPASYRMRVVGLRDDDTDLPIGEQHVPAGAAIDVDVDVRVPKAFAAGRHALAVEVRSDRRDERPGLAGLTVEVSSIQQVTLQVIPSSLKGRLSGRFKLEIDNHETRPIDLQLAGEGPHLSVQLKRTAVTLQPGQRIQVKGKVRGEKRMVRSARNHVLTFSATGKSAPVYTDAGYHQRPIVPRQFRMFLAILVIVALWAGLLGGGLYLWKTRDQRTATAVLAAPLAIDTDGDGILDTAAPGVGIAMGTGQTGADGASAGADGGVAAPGETPAAVAVPEAKPPRPTTAMLSGTVKAGATGKNSGVSFTLVPIKLGNESTTDSVGSAGASRPAKIWPARYGRASQAGVSDQQMTESVIAPLSTTSDDKGVWLIPDVKIPDNYRLEVKANGFDTQQLVVSFSDDGKPVELKAIELQPGTGHAKGVVNGPSGPLGGVAITITDGTLVFQTTSSSKAGEVGQWDLPGLSTPNNYTLTAELAGYGTEVQLLPLAPGGANLAMQINMVPGVGSIRGIATIGNPPHGGVTLTASNADLTRTATSLTVDPQGAFHFPQLPLGVYTITAASPGFQTQTRMVTLGDGSPENPEAVDFALLSTSASVFGDVVNDRGEKLVGVGIKVSRDTATIDSSTAATPSAGRFEIKELPPGKYVVAFDMFNHAPESRAVTLVAGQALDLGTITMKFRLQPTIGATAVVTIPVFDTNDAPLTGATVQFLAVADNKVVLERADKKNEQASFTFKDVPIGTYTVKVSRPNYRTVTKRITVGLDPITKSFQLIKLGQVTGALIDAFNKSRQLDGYSLRIFALDAKGNRDGDALPDPPVVVDRATPNLEGKILWQSPPNALPAGTYELDVVKPPAGYLVRNTQIIDPITIGAKPMQFTISPTDEDTIRLNDLLAVPYPTLKGRLLVPLTSNGDTVSYKPLDATVAVTLSCPSGDSNVPAELVDTNTGVPGLDSYVFSRASIETHKLLGACTIKITSASFQPVSLKLATPLAVSDGVTSSDQIVNIPLTPVLNPTEPVFGFVRWFDYGTPTKTEKLLEGVTVGPSGQVITGFTPSTGDLNTVPTPIRTTVAPFTSKPDGAWVVKGQIFGSSTYNVSRDGFNDGSFDVKMSITTNNTNVRDVSAGTNLKSTAASATSPILVEMEPRNRAMGGNVVLVSNGTKDYAGVRIAKVGPTTNGPADTGTLIGPSATGAFSITDARPGTWKLTITKPDHYVFFPAVISGDPTKFVLEVPLPPGSGEFAIPTTTPIPKMVALASLDVNVLEAGTGRDLLATSTAPTVALNYNSGATPIIGDLIPAVPSSRTAPAVTAFWKYQDLIVPLDGSAALFHKIAVDTTDHDLAAATVTVTVNGVAADPTTLSAANIPLQLRPGDHVVLSIALARFGSLTGSVVGIVGPTASSTEDLLDPSLSAGLHLTAMREFDAAGVALTVPVPADHVIVTPATSTAPGTFKIDGPAGGYRITVTHDQYQAALSSSPTALASTGAPTSLFTPGGVLYRVANSEDRVLATPFTLDLIKGRITVTAVQGNGTSPLAGAKVIVTRSLYPLPAPADTNSDGITSLSGLYPGTYRIEIRKYNPLIPAQDERFPVIVSVLVPRGTLATPGAVTVKGALLELGGSITGTIQAINLDGEAMPMPSGVTITRTYNSSLSPKVVVNSATTVLNSASDTDLSVGSRPSAVTFTPLIALTTPQTFGFTSLAFGVHSLTFSSPVVGYNAPAPKELTVDDNTLPAVPKDAGTVSYTAKNVVVKVNLNSSTGAPIFGATVRLIDPDTGEPIPLAVQPGDPTNRYTALSVVPEFLQLTPAVTQVYGLIISHPLYGLSESTVFVGVRDDALIVPITMTPTKAGVNGLIKKQLTESPSSIDKFDNVKFATIELYKLRTAGATLDPTLDTFIDSTTTDVNGDYALGVPDTVLPGSFYVVASSPGFAPRQSGVRPLTITDKGSSANFNLTLPKYAQAKVTVLGAAAAADTTVTMSTFGVTPLTCTTMPLCTFASLDPDKSYSWTITAATFFPKSIPSINPDIGDVTTAVYNVTPVQRIVEVQVILEVPAACTDPFPSVSIAIPSGIGAIPAAQDITPSGADAGSYRFRFTGVPLGAGTITVSEAGCRTVTVTVSNTDVTNTATIDLSYAVNLKPPVQYKVKVVGGSPLATNVIATPAGGGTAIQSTLSGGFYTIQLDSGSWTFAATLDGTGEAHTTTPFVVTGLTATGPGSPQDLTLTLVPRTVTVVINVTGTTGASISFPADIASGAPFTIVESNLPSAYTVTKEGYVVVSDSGSGSATYAIGVTTPISVVMEAKPVLKFSGVAGAVVTVTNGVADSSDPTKFYLNSALLASTTYTVIKEGYVTLNTSAVPVSPATVFANGSTTPIDVALVAKPVLQFTGVVGATVTLDGGNSVGVIDSHDAGLATQRFYMTSGLSSPTNYSVTKTGYSPIVSASAAADSPATTFANESTTTIPVVLLSLPTVQFNVPSGSTITITSGQTFNVSGTNLYTITSGTSPLAYTVANPPYFTLTGSVSFASGSPATVSGMVLRPLLSGTFSSAGRPDFFLCRTDTTVVDAGTCLLSTGKVAGPTSVGGTNYSFNLPQAIGAASGTLIIVAKKDSNHYIGATVVWDGSSTTIAGPTLDVSATAVTPDVP